MVRARREITPGESGPLLCQGRPIAHGEASLVGFSLTPKYVNPKPINPRTPSANPTPGKQIQFKPKHRQEVNRKIYPPPDPDVGLVTFAGSRRCYRLKIRALRIASRRKIPRLRFTSRKPDFCEDFSTGWEIQNR